MLPRSYRFVLLAAVSWVAIGCPSPPAVVDPKPITPPPPAPVPPPALADTSIVDIATFHEHTCLLRKSGQAACWGKNTYGQVGNGAREDVDELTDVASVADAASIEVGRDFSCAVRRGGAVWCWGNNEDGQLGDAKGVEPGALNLSPVAVSGLGSVEQLSLGEYHACAVHDGAVSCWGNGANGQIGSADDRAFGIPKRIDKLGRVVQVAAGASHVCALEKLGSVKCWGRNSEGQLGADVTGSRVNAVRVKNLSAISQIASGHNHSCAVRSDGELWCWGDNKSRQLGPKAGTDTRHKTPIAVPIKSVAQVAAGDAHTCVRQTSGTVLCWGDNSEGQLGTGEKGDPQAEPQPALGINDAIDLSLGLAQSCAVRKDGTAVCWGKQERKL